MELYGIFGAGGFGREVMPVAEEMLKIGYARGQEYELVFIEEGRERPGIINGHRVISDIDFLNSDASKHFNVAIADSRIRERIANKMIEAGIPPFTITALNSVQFDENEIGEGAILCPFTTVTSNAKIGRFFHANIYSYVAHDCMIGDFVTFAPDVHCNGNTVIEDYAYIGTGAIMRQGTEDKPLVIGKGAIVGMGAVVTRDVPPGVTVVGCPAAPITKKAPTF